jgi:hypothetical protein
MKQTKQRTPSWRPKANGTRYCAPACGRGCTRAEYDAAVANAAALVKRLRGTGWKPLVFENMGWHWRAVSGPVQVYPTDGGTKFWCMIGDRVKGSPGGLAMWTPSRCAQFKDPNRAVRDALLHVERKMANLNEVLAAARKAAGTR